jgi:hypothetical protein
MNLLTVVLVLAVPLWALGFVVSGLVPAEEVVRRRPGGEGSPLSRGLGRSGRCSCSGSGGPRGDRHHDGRPGWPSASGCGTRRPRPIFFRPWPAAPAERRGRHH